jgi:hypothetical protein
LRHSNGPKQVSPSPHKVKLPFWDLPQFSPSPHKIKLPFRDLPQLLCSLRLHSLKLVDGGAGVVEAMPPRTRDSLEMPRRYPTAVLGLK